MSRTARRLAARAGREVILSGGSINTPQLLQLSGIGPAALLGDLGIPVVRDNAEVGANLQDHQGHQLHLEGQGADAQPDAAAVVGQARRRHALSPAARRPAVDEHEPGRRLLPHRPVRDAAQHAALLPGLLDGDPEERRAADPDAGPVAGLFDRPVQLPADQPRLGDDPLERSVGAAEDRGERLFDQSRRRRDARRGEVPAPHRGAAVDGQDDRRRDAAGTGAATATTS